MGHAYERVSLGLKDEGKTADMCCYVDGPRGGYTGGSKPARLGHRLCGSTDGRGPEQSGSQDSPKMAPGADGEGRGEWVSSGFMVSVWEDEVLEMDSADGGTQQWDCAPCHWSYTLKAANW